MRAKENRAVIPSWSDTHEKGIRQVLWCGRTQEGHRGLFPEWQGQGIATDALRRLCEYARLHLALHQLYAFVAEDNERAQTLFRRAGFSAAARLTDWLRRSNSFTDALLFQKVL